VTTIAAAPPAEVTDRPRPSAGPDDPRKGEARPAWLFIAPFGIFFVLFLVWPVIYMVITSLFNTSIVGNGFGSFAGFGNYAEMLGQRLFWESLWHTVYFTIITTISPSSCRSCCRRPRSR
jgi:multiple sugar transport system permease protein